MDLSRYSGFRRPPLLATISFFILSSGGWVKINVVYPEVSVCKEGSPALYLMRDPKPLESAGDRMEERLVLVHLRAGSGTDACVSGVHIIGFISARASHCHMFLNPHEAPSNTHELCRGYDP